MTLVAVPVPMKAGHKLTWMSVAGVVALIAMGGYWGFAKWQGQSASTIDPGAKFYAVAPIDFDVKVTKDGELAAVNNIDILNLVEGQTTIVQIVKEGAYVKKGDVLVELDSSDIRQKIEDATLEQQKSEADLVVAKELRAIQESENAANLEASEVDVELASLGLKQYVDGTYPQDLEDAKTAVEMSNTTVKNKQEELEQTQSLYGKGFVTGSDVKQDELELIQAKNTQASNRMKLKVLKEYTYPSDLAAKKSKLVQSQQALERVKKKNASNLSKYIADEKAAEQTLTTKKRKVEHLEQQLALCIIKAPTDGLVVYAGDRNYQQSQVAEGAQVRERQQLLRLPDTSSMKAVVRINESHVPKLRVGQKALVKIVGVAEPVTATLTKISPLADSGSRWWNPDLKEYPVELTLDSTPKDVKPGIGVQAEIYTNQMDDVLAVPLAAIYSNHSNNYVFVRDEASRNIKPVEVKIGETNETHARIASGISAGQDVLILEAGQGRDLLERAGIRTSEAETTPDRLHEPKGKPEAVVGKTPTPAAVPQAAVVTPSKASSPNSDAKPDPVAGSRQRKPKSEVRVKPAA